MILWDFDFIFYDFMYGFYVQFTTFVFSTFGSGRIYIYIYQSWILYWIWIWISISILNMTMNMNMSIEYEYQSCLKYQSSIMLYWIPSQSSLYIAP